MTALFATPGMTMVSLTVLFLEVLSFLVMGLILLAFGRLRRKQEDLFRTLHNAPVALVHHSVLVWVYVLMTIGIGVVSLFLFVFQPHIL